MVLSSPTPSFRLFFHLSLSFRFPSNSPFRFRPRDGEEDQSYVDLSTFRLQGRSESLPSAPRVYYSWTTKSSRRGGGQFLSPKSESLVFFLDPPERRLSGSEVEHCHQSPDESEGVLQRAERQSRLATTAFSVTDTPNPPDSSAYTQERAHPRLLAPRLGPVRGRASSLELQEDTFGFQGVSQPVTVHAQRAGHSQAARPRAFARPTILVPEAQQVALAPGVAQVQPDEVGPLRADHEGQLL